MSRCYLDTNFLYVHLRSHESESRQATDEWRTAVLVHATTDGAVISALVLDELAYRLILAWLRDDGVQDPLSAYRADTKGSMRAVLARLENVWRAVDSLSLELQPTDQAVIERSRTLMSEPGLGPRDAFHAAHALIAGCTLIASTDADFDQVPGLRRLAPTNAYGAAPRSDTAP